MTNLHPSILRAGCARREMIFLAGCGCRMPYRPRYANLTSAAMSQAELLYFWSTKWGSAGSGPASAGVHQAGQAPPRPLTDGQRRDDLAGDGSYQLGDAILGWWSARGVVVGSYEPLDTRRTTQLQPKE